MPKRWTATAAYPTIPFQYVFERVQRPIPDGAGIVTAYTDGEVTLRSNRRTEGYHNAKDLSTYQGVEPGDFVVHGLDILRGSVGVSDSRGAMSPVCTVAAAREGHDARYHGYTIRAQAQSGYTKALARGIREGGADFRRWETLASLPLLAPPLDVQRRVADTLDAETARIRALISKNKQVIDTLDRRLQALVDTTFAPHVEETVALGYVALVLTSGIDKHAVVGQRSVRLCNYTDVYYLREVSDSANFMVATCSQSEYDRLRLLSGDVVMTKDSETADDIAVPAIIRIDDTDLVLGYHNALLRVLDDRITPDFLYWYLQTRIAHDHFALKARGVTRVGLRVEDIAALPISIPPRDTQNDVVERLWQAQRRTDRLKSMVRNQIELLKTRRQSLITAAVTGQITV